jgi:oleandomycin transport system permease protein
VRYLILCVMFLGFGYAIGFRGETNPAALLGAVALAIGFALCFCWLSLWVGLKARSPGSVQGIMFLLIFPLSFGSSAFVRTATMPGWLQAWTKINPITRLVDTMRSLMLGGPVTNNLLITLGWMAGLLALFVPLALRAYKRRA